MSNIDYSFITDRLAVGNVASRAVPGFVAVVSLLATQPWDELTGAPEILGSIRLPAQSFLDLGPHPLVILSVAYLFYTSTSPMVTQRVRPDNGETYGNDLDSFLDATSFIAAHIWSARRMAHVQCRISSRQSSVGYLDELAMAGPRR